nr:uncharacterized protein LOC125182201 [Anser cygnoides]XP_047914815.1 uncharacterized protein LOC125182201 [Anser cygnoides]XP_047914816.1 uncharacterized protein LOC125182201 [Anser cygnoides]XP_047914817.1 uncharacterized protein LOC125182201 [Anser cygnoides]XP_047914819.1 uncharacterized protein LOC125182201 [Anser cygnoides]
MDEGCVVTMQKAQRDGVLAPNAFFFFFLFATTKKKHGGGRGGKAVGAGRERSEKLVVVWSVNTSPSAPREKGGCARQTRGAAGRRRGGGSPCPPRVPAARPEPRGLQDSAGHRSQPTRLPGPAGLLADRRAVEGAQTSARARGWDRTGIGWHETARGLQNPFKSSLSLVQISRSSLGLGGQDCSGRARPSSCVACDRALYCRRANKRSERGSAGGQWCFGLSAPARPGPARLWPGPGLRGRLWVLFVRGRGAAVPPSFCTGTQPHAFARVCLGLRCTQRSQGCTQQ